jgi:hypothetical protein
MFIASNYSIELEHVCGGNEELFVRNRAGRIKPLLVSTTKSSELSRCKVGLRVGSLARFLPSRIRIFPPASISSRVP